MPKTSRNYWNLALKKRHWRSEISSPPLVCKRCRGESLCFMTSLALWNIVTSSEQLSLRFLLALCPEAKHKSALDLSNHSTLLQPWTFSTSLSIEWTLAKFMIILRLAFDSFLECSSRLVVHFRNRLVITDSLTYRNIPIKGLRKSSQRPSEVKKFGFF